MADPQDTLAHRLAEVRRRIAGAAARAGRDPAGVTLVLVTKSAPESIFAEAASVGLREVGESRVQQAEQRHEGRDEAFRWHLIGHLQANKVRRAVRLFDVLHGVDSAALLAKVDAAAADLGRRPEVLLQVNVSGEASKHGLTPAQLPAVLAAAATLEHARVVGLMTMAPAGEGEADARVARACFRELATLRARHAQAVAGVDGAGLAQLSMGMSDDFELAVEEGATLVRIGRALVGPAQAPRRAPPPAARPRLVVLLSGGGRTLLNLVAAIEQGRLWAQIPLVISSRRDAQGIARAREAGLTVDVLRPRDFPDAAAFAAEQTRRILAARPDLVIMAGYLVHYPVPAALAGRILNIHPALLPRHGGRGLYGERVHAAVLAAGDRESGCTVHVVDDEYDHGRIVAQARVPVRPGDTVDALAARVFEAECALYPRVIADFLAQAARTPGDGREPDGDRDRDRDGDSDD